MLDYFLQNKATGYIYRLTESTKGTYRIIENNRLGNSIRIIKEYKQYKNALKYFEELSNKPLIEKRNISELPWR